jgi:hypothetical protein
LIARREGGALSFPLVAIFHIEVFLPGVFPASFFVGKMPARIPTRGRKE